MTNPQPVGARRRRALLPLVAVLVVLAGVFGLRFRQLGSGEAVAGIRAVQETEGVPVETVAAGAADLETWITLAGTVEGGVQYPVVSNNALRVVGLPVREGDRVAAGDVIIRLADDAPSPMYHNVEKIRANHAQALVDVRRLRNLYADGAVARADLDAAETRLAGLAADLQTAEGSIALTATAPGTVTAILVDEGETVKTGKPLAWVADARRAKLVFDAGSGQALALAAGQTARWLLPDGTTGGEGAVARLDLMADPETHLLRGEASFANADGRLVPGLLVSFQVRTQRRAGALVVPRACLVARADGAAVWVVADEGGGPVARLRPVTTGAADADRVEILDGLAAGDLAVRHGQTLLRDGVRVRTVAPAGGEG